LRDRANAGVWEDNMMKSNTIFRMFVCVLAVAMSLISSPAFAQTNAVATSNVNVRQGPGTNYAVVQVLRQGDGVNIVRCSNGWCLVDLRSDRGWVSRSFLRDVIASPGGNRPGPSIDLNINIGVGRPSLGGSGRRVCFYEDVNFRGRSFCARPGESQRTLGNWNNRISSIAVEGRSTRVDVCTERNFRNCSTFNGDVPVLNRMLQQNISSLSVR
jgi:uncharacterized protein YraI